MDASPLSPGERNLVSRLQKNTLHCEVDGFNYRRFWLEPSGVAVPPGIPEKMIRRGLLVSAGDGLLEDQPQTWRLA